MSTESITPSGSDHVESTASTAPAAAASDPKAAGEAKAGTGSYDSDETFGSLAELRDKQPELFNKMMEGLAQNIVMKIKRNETRLRELQKQYRNG